MYYISLTGNYIYDEKNNKIISSLYSSVVKTMIAHSLKDLGINKNHYILLNEEEFAILKEVI